MNQGPNSWVSNCMVRDN